MSDSELASIQPAVDLARVAQRVNDIYRSASFDLSFRIGQLIIRELFSNDTRLWRRDGVRSTSYRALAARGDLLLSASALCRAVGIYVLAEQLGGRDRWRHLSASHFQEVLSIDCESRATLLEAAEENEWSVSRIRTEVREHKKVCVHRSRQNRRGRAHIQALKRLGSRLAGCQVVLSRMDLSEAEEDSMRNIRNAVRTIYHQLAELSAMVETRAIAGSHPPRVRELVESHAPSSHHG